jgi:hypothetical protein
MNDASSSTFALKVHPAPLLVEGVDHGLRFGLQRLPARRLHGLSVRDTLVLGLRRAIFGV